MIRNHNLRVDYIEYSSGMNIEDMPFGCRLCAERAYNEDVIAETSNFFSVPDIRSIVPGHVQIISNSHKTDDGRFMFSAGHYQAEWFDDYEKFIGFMGKSLYLAYAKKPIWFEHGEKEVNPRPGSIYHPHIIGIPLGYDIADIIKTKGKEYFKLEKRNNMHLSELRSIVEKGPYYFYQSPDGERYIMRVRGDTTPSQLIIKFISEIPEVKKANSEWIRGSNESIPDGKEYMFQYFRPHDRFFDCIESVRNSARLIARKRKITNKYTDYNSLFVKL